MTDEVEYISADYRDAEVVVKQFVMFLRKLNYDTIDLYVGTDVIGLAIKEGPWFDDEIRKALFEEGIVDENDDEETIKQYIEDVKIPI